MLSKIFKNYKKYLHLLILLNFQFKNFIQKDRDIGSLLQYKIETIAYKTILQSIPFFDRLDYVSMIEIFFRIWCGRC